MRNRNTFALAFLLATGTACPSRFVSFETGTVVENDGGLTRFTRYAASGAMLDELRKRYVLPDNGTWAHSSQKRVNDSSGEEYFETVHVYTLVEAFGPGENVPSDHVRFAEGGGRAVRNDVELVVHDYIVARHFTFREEIHDREGHELLVAELEKTYPLWASRLSEEIAERLEGVSRTEASNALTRLCSPWVEKFVRGERMESAVVVEFLLHGENELAEALTRELVSSSDSKIEDHKRSIAEAIQAANEETLDEERVGDILFGVYEFNVLFGPSYDLRQKLWMPGWLLSTNADSIEGRTLAWEVNTESIVLQSHIAEAESLVLFPVRITIAIAAIGILMLAGTVFVVAPGIRRLRSRS